VRCSPIAFVGPLLKVDGTNMIDCPSLDIEPTEMGAVRKVTHVQGVGGAVVCVHVPYDMLLQL